MVLCMRMLTVNLHAAQTRSVFGNPSIHYQQKQILAYLITTEQGRVLSKFLPWLQCHVPI